MTIKQNREELRQVRVQAIAVCTVGLCFRRGPHPCWLPSYTFGTVGAFVARVALSADMHMARCLLPREVGTGSSWDVVVGYRPPAGEIITVPAAGWPGNAARIVQWINLFIFPHFPLLQMGTKAWFSEDPA